MKLFSRFFLVLAGLFFCAAMAQAESDTAFELRTYTTFDGKLANLNERFANHTAGLFEKHGMQNIGYWVPQDSERASNTLIYILSHKSRAAAAKSWQAFNNDPEWHKVREASIK